MPRRRRGRQGEDDLHLLLDQRGRNSAEIFIYGDLRRWSSW